MLLPSNMLRRQPYQLPPYSSNWTSFVQLDVVDDNAVIAFDSPIHSLFSTVNQFLQTFMEIPSCPFVVSNEV